MASSTSTRSVSERTGLQQVERLVAAHMAGSGVVVSYFSVSMCALLSGLLPYDMQSRGKSACGVPGISRLVFNTRLHQNQTCAYQ